MKSLMTFCVVFAVGAACIPASRASDATPQARALGLEGAANFCDIGGYIAANGKRVRWREVYRSNELSKLTMADTNKVASIKLVSVIDLRTEEEQWREPSVWLHEPADMFVSPKTILAPVMKTILAEAATPAGARAGMIDFYARMPDDFHEEYAALFHRIAADRLPILVHCTAGEDRTGVAMAILLTTLGVSQDTVLDDYTLTEKLTPSVEAAAKRSAAVGGKCRSVTVCSVTSRVAPTGIFADRDHGIGGSLGEVLAVQRA